MSDERRRWLDQVWAKARAKSPERKDDFPDHERHRARAGGRAGEPRRALPRGDSGSPASTRSPAASSPRCTAAVTGRCASTPGFGSAEDANARYHYLLKSGQTGLSVAFDLPTQMGRDADHPRARGEVGKVGVSISSLRDMEVLLEGIPLGEVSTSMTINSTAAILLSLYAAVGEQQGVPLEKLSGTVQNDILKEYIARGTYVYPPRESLRLVTDVFAFCAKRVPRWNPISISGYHIREAGSTAAQEIAFTLGNGIAYVEAARRAGLEVDAFAGRLSFFFNVHNNFLEEIAKFRAARRLWARVMKERFGAKDPRSQMLRFHAQTAGLDAHRAAAGEQRGAGGAAGDGGGARRRAVAAHQQQGRGAGASERGSGEAGAPDAADHRPRDRRGGRHRSARRQLHAGAADRRARGPGRGLPREDRRPRRDGRGDRQGLSAAGDPGRGLPGAAGARDARVGRRRA